MNLKTRYALYLKNLTGYSVTRACGKVAERNTDDAKLDVQERNIMRLMLAALDGVKRAERGAQQERRRQQIR